MCNESCYKSCKNVKSIIFKPMKSFLFVFHNNVKVAGYTINFSQCNMLLINFLMRQLNTFVKNKHCVFSIKFLFRQKKKYIPVLNCGINNFNFLNCSLQKTHNQRGKIKSEGDESVKLVHENNHLMWLVWWPGVSSPCPLQPLSDQCWGGVRQLLTACHSLGGWLVGLEGDGLGCGPIPHTPSGLITWQTLPSYRKALKSAHSRTNSPVQCITSTCNSPPTTSLKVDFSDLGTKCML